MCAGAGRELDLQARRPSSTCLPSSLPTPLQLTALLPWGHQAVQPTLRVSSDLCGKLLISDLIVFKSNVGGF